MKNVLHAKCVRCGRTYEAIPTLTTCQCGGILDIVYDYDYSKTRLTRETLAGRRDNSMWRYRELLPVEESTENTPLRVGWSPRTGRTLWPDSWASPGSTSKTTASTPPPP